MLNQGVLMKKILLVLVLVFFTFLLSCSEDDPTNPTILKKYPTKKNMEWEYTTTTILDYYDTLGHIIDTENFDLGNTIVKIINTDDSLGIYSNLIKFECYDVQTANSKNYNWYSNSDTAFKLIAYSNSGSSQLVYPKSGNRRYLTLEELHLIIKLTNPAIFTFSNSNPVDSILFYEIPRQVLAYPLSLNKRWVELVYPWYRERYVSKVVQEMFQGHALRCYVVKVDWPDYDIEFNDYINLDKGLLKREILADSIIITSISNPDSGGFGRLSTNSNLVRLSE
jgi:hypothetical protein